jgi:hypothetical protein
MNAPPLTSTHCPVMYAVHGDTSAMTAPAASSTLPSRCSGIEDFMPAQYLLAPGMPSGTCACVCVRVCAWIAASY